MNRPQLVVLDLDGTLIDSAPDLAFATCQMLKKIGREQVSEVQIQQWIGNGVSMLVKRALSSTMNPDRTASDFEPAMAVFSKIYEQNVSTRSTLYPGVIEGLKQLRDHQIKLACVTNKHSRFTRPLMEQTGLGIYFDYVGCGDDFEHLKPHPEPLLQTAQRFCADPVYSIMVGDSNNDIKAARAAGFQAVCVPYGYLNGLRVEDLEADIIIDSLAELPGLFEEAA